jgi:hypothetical protein
MDLPMPHCYYTCNLLPAAFLARAGYEPRWFGAHALVRESAGRFDSPNVHPMTCPFVTRLVTAAERMLAEGSAEDKVVVPGGCDAMRRAGDLLASQYPDRVRTFRLPRFGDEGALTELTQELERLDQWLRNPAREPTAGDPTAQEPTAGGPTEAPRTPDPGTGSDDARRGFDLPSATRPGGVFVVGGPLSDGSLLDFILKLGLPISGVESCTAPARWQALDGTEGSEKNPAPSSGPGTGPSSATTHESGAGCEDTARLILAQAVCPRRSSADRRAHLSRRMSEARPSSVIYARLSFCDPGAYDALLVADLAGEQGLPFLEVEVGFPLEVSGPLRTRVEAFLEAQLLDDDLLGESDQFDQADRGDEFDELDGLLDDDLLDDSVDGDHRGREEG